MGSQIINIGGTNDPQKGPNQGPSNYVAGQPLEDLAPHKQSIAERNNEKLTRYLSQDITVQYSRSFFSASKDANLLKKKVELVNIPPTLADKASHLYVTNSLFIFTLLLPLQ